MKEKSNVLSEVNLMMMCYNLRRLVSFLGIDSLKTRLRELAQFIWRKTDSFLASLRVYLLLTKQPKLLIPHSYNGLNDLTLTK